MATIKDVAKLAGVGAGTVSRFLSGNGAVSAQAKIKIQKAIDQLNYRPSSVARSLSSQRSEIIGIWVPSLSGPFHHQMLRAAENELRQYGKHLILANAQDAPDDEARLSHLDYLINKDCDGILMSCAEFSEVELARITGRYPNLVLFNRQVANLPGKAFYVDHELGGRLAACKLVELGHRKVATITGRLSAQDARQRHRGFIEEMTRLGQPVTESRIIQGSYSMADGRKAAEQLLASGVEFSAVFCGNDEVALALISTLAERGISVPGDVSVMGYDDVDFAAYTTPALTTLHVPIEEMTRSACRQLLNLTYGLDLPFKERFEPVVCKRATTRRLT